MIAINTMFRRFLLVTPVNLEKNHTKHSMFVHALDLCQNRVNAQSSVAQTQSESNKVDVFNKKTVQKCAKQKKTIKLMAQISLHPIFECRCPKFRERHYCNLRALPVLCAVVYCPDFSGAQRNLIPGQQSNTATKDQFAFLAVFRA